ncbi:unnamed protein product [Prorocentrum cordatum]|uniref:Uncharacterized protein n=1 Tax=Prorocentrum cordatum TaxID=2364126 RepID=A0ABN9QVB6_9DINO|nr:unnamed protein product [Polarella glacialis]
MAALRARCRRRGGRPSSLQLAPLLLACRASAEEPPLPARLGRVAAGTPCSPGGRQDAGASEEGWQGTLQCIFDQWYDPPHAAESSRARFLDRDAEGGHAGGALAGDGLSLAGGAALLDSVRSVGGAEFM